MKTQSPLEEIADLHRLFTVEHIMVPISKLERASTLEQAVPGFKDYDNIISPKTGAIKGYFSRIDRKHYLIEKKDLLGGGTSLLDLPALFGRRDFYYVLHGNEIAGYVHYSDLNNNYVRVPVFGLLQIVERKMWSKIKQKVDADTIKRILPERFEEIVAKKERNDSYNVGLGWADVLYFAEILQLAASLKAVDLDDSDISKFGHVRNGVAHPSRTFVPKRNTIEEIALVCKKSMDIVQSA